ncbi:helix-turn-helix transcriptional regulator, partial [Billgrantia saliphila]|uniref:helix-turn-helix transcriptional regulator n=1 Tax=Billgrantia saliphila TaxID=1848458 RepID=UPI0012DF7776
RRQLHEHPAQPHSLTALAEQAAMSPATLRRKFQAAFGCSVFDYLRDRRLDVAREALLQGSSVEQAAHLAGYHHASNLATAFRRRFGYSPSSLRHCE